MLYSEFSNLSAFKFLPYIIRYIIFWNYLYIFFKYKYRFPLIDGTLFVSPILYDPKKGVSSLISNKKQFIYGICLNCLSATDPDHKIECSFCHKLWLNGRTLQIGSLIKPPTNPLFDCFKLLLFSLFIRYSL